MVLPDFSESYAFCGANCAPQGLRKGTTLAMKRLDRGEKTTRYVIDGAAAMKKLARSKGGALRLFLAREKHECQLRA